MNNINKLLILFEQFAYTQNEAAALNDFLDYFLLAFRYHETAEEQKPALETLINHPKRELLSKMLIEVGELSENFNDPLGELCETLISKGRNGQFFTPGPIKDLLTALVYDSNAKQGDMVLDPACGSGRMLLSAAKRNRHRLFYGADIDPLCCKMALMNMLLHSLTGEIAHMDSLSNKFFHGYVIGTVLLNGHHHPYYKPFTDPEQSRIWLRSKENPSQEAVTDPSESMRQPSERGVQGNLFDEL
ncbi:HsdM family class I SAM-dependent methyltransferase [Mucilaginibacter kameinonensis]|uniref:HsdM family class I SAM-dependent methyltransferase n=1 Tax=Mucilaginibacter kameinonensis TaxID=452286 RepID=UPI000EF7BB4C|nr:N-6 DNA methylase [Mucilaginibacter kameinonensis]